MRGEILIERQIEQLKAAGINDIVIVVGYKKESFFYLEDKYGVKIVINRVYAERNNNSSLMLVREILGNTYICSSDNYFEENPLSIGCGKRITPRSIRKVPPRNGACTQVRAGESRRSPSAAAMPGS